MKWIKVKKKPVEVEAFQLTEKMFEIDFMKMRKMSDSKIDTIKTMFLGNSFLVKTLEGDMTAKVGDYIIKGIRGEIYPCRKDIFEESYERSN